MSCCATRPLPNRKSPPESGAAIIPVLVMVMVIMALSVATLGTSIERMDRIKITEQAIHAQEIAETAVARAMYELERDADLDSTSGIGNVAGVFGDGTFTAVAIPMSGLHYRIQAIGTYEGVSKRVEVIAAIPLTIYGKYGLFSANDLTISGSASLDSFDSTLGTYASQAINSDAYGSFANEDARVASNGGITIGASSVLRGDASPGPNSAVTFQSGATLTGSAAPLESPVALPDPPIEAFQAAHANNQNGSWTASGTVSYDSGTQALTVTSGTLTLGPGTYFFSSLQVAGGASLVVTGETKIYVVGDIDIAGGGVVNQTANSKDLEIIAHPHSVPPSYTPPSVPTASIGGGPSTSFAFYGPSYDVSLHGNADVTGAILGDTVTIGGGVSFHHDTALGQATGLEGADRRRKFMRMSWRDLSGPLY